MELAYKSYVGGNSSDYYYDYSLLYLIWAGNNDPLGWHPPHVVGNTDTLYLGDQHWQQTALVFLDFCFSVFAYVSVSLCIYGSVCNPFQIFQNSFLWCSQGPLSQNMIKTQWLTSGDWGCPLDDDPKLVLVKRSSR